MRHAGVTGATSHEWARGRGNNNTNNNVNVSCQASNKSMVWMHPSLLYSVSLIIMFGLLLNNISHRQFWVLSTYILTQYPPSLLSPAQKMRYLLMDDIFVVKLSHIRFYWTNQNSRQTCGQISISAECWLCGDQNRIDNIICLHIQVQPEV